MEAVVYISHGSRSEEWNEQFIQFIQTTFTESVAPIQTYGFFELAKPSIGEAIATCIEKGATKVTVVPVLLLSGNHGLIDIPTEISEAQALFPQVPMFYAPVVGPDLKIVPAIVEKLKEKGFTESVTHSVLLVAHGSGHDETAQELGDLSRLVEEHLGSQQRVEWGYLSRQPHYLPRLHQIVSESEHGQVFIVPHFLAKGGFTAKIERQLNEEFGDQTCRERIILCDPTGYHSALHTLLRDRASMPRIPVIKQMQD